MSEVYAVATLELVRPIRRQYSQLDTDKDHAAIHKVFVEATRIYHKRLRESGKAGT